jgi:hypothetical protein
MKRRQFLHRTGALLAASLAFPAVVRADLKAARVLRQNIFAFGLRALQMSL